ncbi:Short-chain dehydrogenase/reductase (SDR) superfamily protein [Enhygromyxa salina]|uniref:Short-chain dehydrogenase/reductase (SDR) superfamily protein n=1 Tax=Enhygromyxa salina TaxID=215803 RepID=A0A0C2D195_9BACT|nr:SDR family oxidoreductase [Enhygromyxa salina]KIG15595.1 Short-chain dehydrogenase/reductase (SDR) superfamily protein [Enhygromyxa salina]
MANILITGANRGIGLELARLLNERDDHVVAACRSSSPELDALGVQVETGVEVSDSASLERLNERLGDLALDLLINNAGILARTSLDALDFQSIERQFQVNAIGPLRVVTALKHRLGAGAKIAIVSSRMGSLADNSSGGSYGYRMSKAAANMAGVSLAHDLRPAGIAVALLHPGWVQTEMTGGRGDTQAKDAARGLLARIDELSLETSGGFWHQNGERLPW